jgi:ribosomal protein L27
MEFKDQLPTPGKKIKNGFEVVQQKDFTLFSVRPDYQKFKSKKGGSQLAPPA